MSRDHEAPFVARAVERAVIEDALRRAEHDDGLLIALSGEAGIGKTRLASEALEMAASRGFATAQGRAFPFDATSAYAPILDALGPALRASPQGIEALVAGLAPLARLFPWLPIEPPPPSRDAALDRAALFEAVVHVVARLATDSPVALVIDDLHWADRSTVEFVHHLGRRLAGLPVVLLVTSRSGEAGNARVQSMVGALARADRAVAIEVARLDENAVSELAAGLLGAPAGPRLLEVLEARAAGTPLFVEAVVAGLRDAGGLSHEDGQWQTNTAGSPPGAVPGAFEVIADRLARIPPHDRAIVELLAVAGDPLPLRVLGSVIVANAGEVADPLPALERLRIAGLVVELPEGGDVNYAFTHPLYAEVTEAGLAVTVVRRTHARLAAALERHAPESAERIARHYLAAGGEGDPNRAVEALVSAGRRAAGSFAHDDVLRFFGAALDLVRAGLNPELLTELLDRLGEAHAAVGSPERAVEAWTESLALHEQAGDMMSASRVRRGLAETVWSLGQFDEAAVHLKKAQANLDAEGSAEELALVLLTELDMLHRFGDRAGAAQAAEQLNAVLIRGVPPRTDLLANVMLLHLGTVNASPSALHDCEALLATAEEMQDLELVRAARQQLIGLSLSRGDHRRGIRHASASLEVGKRLGALTLVEMASSGLVVAELLAGDWDSAEEHARAGVDMIGAGDEPRAHVGVNAGRALVHVLRGNLDAAAEHIAEAERWGGAMDRVEFGAYGMLVLAQCLLAVEHGFGEVVIPTAKSRGVDFTNYPPYPILVFTEGAIVAGDVTEARRVAAGFAEGLWPERTLPHGLAARLRGLADTVDRLDSAADELRLAVEIFDELAMPFDAARARLDLSVAPGITDDDAAVAATTALAVFDRLKANRYGDRARRRLRELGQRPALRPRRKGQGTLTSRQREIAELVAEGLTNGQIAERLVLSVRTVTSHLDHVYVKLGIRSRAALARYVSERPGESDEES